MNAEKRRQKVIVIGAGLGGLSAAISLAAEGFRVEVLEKNDKVGGKLNVLDKDGFTFDLGPSILTMPHIFRRVFEQAGKKLEDYVRIRPVEPHWRNFFEDGTVFDLCGDPESMRSELSKLDDKAVEEFKRFMDYSKKLGQVTERGYF
ncbi:MAG: phytoene desaturase family protein, partial [Gammaproteobacteria bacterium]